MKLSFRVLEDDLSICRFLPDASVPDWVWTSRFYSITKTDNELSIVASSRSVPKDEHVPCESHFRAIGMEGTLDFSLIGILAEIGSLLAQKGISIFAISTYDTDYILVGSQDLKKAVFTLREAGHTVMWDEEAV